VYATGKQPVAGVFYQGLGNATSRHRESSLF